MTIAGVGFNPLRTGLLLTLEEMGAGVTVANRRVEGGEPVGDLVVTGRRSARCRCSAGTGAQR